MVIIYWYEAHTCCIGSHGSTF